MYNYFVLVYGKAANGKIYKEFHRWNNENTAMWCACHYRKIQYLKQLTDVDGEECHIISVVAFKGELI